MPNIFLGKTSADCSHQIIKKLKDNYTEKPFARHIVIVPDRVSVSTEVNIFKSLNIESTCLIEVLTLSRLSSKILNNMQVITKSASCMIVQKILKENKDDLKVFNKNLGIDFATKIYETISQFKSCKILPENVFAKTQDEVLQNKLHDTQIIYTKYEEFLKQNGLFDAMDRLDFLYKKIKTSNYIKNSFVYVLNFDNFTYQGFQTIFDIAKNCQEFNIGVVDSDNPLNEHIYDKDHKNKIVNHFNFEGIKPNIIYCEEMALGDFKHLQDNLFAYGLVSKINSNGCINLFEGSNFEEELLHVCAQIKNMVVNKNYLFEDFFVAVPNLQDKTDIIAQIFDDYGFNYFIDSNVEFKNTVIVKLVEDLIFVLQENFSKTSMISLAKNILFGLERKEREGFCKYIEKYSINDYFLLKSTKFQNDEDFESFDLVRGKLFDVLEEILKNYRSKEEICFGQWAEIFENIFEKLNIEGNLKQIATKLLNKNQIKKARMVEQYFYLMHKVLDEIKNVVSNKKCDFKTFCDVLLSGVSATKVSVAPISTNCVFIGDTNASFFEDCRVGFVVDASEENFPQKINDFGIVSDQEISLLADFYKLEPTIEELNKRARFKCFEVLLKPCEKLFLSYNYEGSSKKSKVLDDACKMFCEVVGTGFKQLEFKNYNNLDLKIKNNNIKIAKRNFVADLKKVLDGQQQTGDEIELLSGNVNCKRELELANFKNHISLKENIFFVKNTISVSQVESFMTCPFLHFCRYGLKLFDKEESDFNYLDIGNILHEVAKIFVQRKKHFLPEREIKSAVGQIFDEILQGDKYIFLTQNLANKILLKNLKDEAFRFCKTIAYQTENSLFKPMSVEARFDGAGKINGLKIKAGNKILSLVGQIDRIDVFKDYFRIIDYKTGSCSKSFKELFFGKKIQLEAYLKVVEKHLKLKPAGFYYMPVKSKFAENNKDLEEGYKLVGVTSSSRDVIDASDVRLKNCGTSDIINIRFLKDGRVDSKCKVFDFETIENMADYAIKLIEKASGDILKLDITPKPIVIENDPCKKCKFFSFCKFDEQFGNVKRKPNFEVDKNFFSTKIWGGEE